MGPEKVGMSVERDRRLQRRHVPLSPPPLPSSILAANTLEIGHRSSSGSSWPDSSASSLSKSGRIRSRVTLSTNRSPASSSGWPPLLAAAGSARGALSAL